MVKGFKELRNSQNRLLCIANDSTGEVKTEGPHHSSYDFLIPIGGSFRVKRDNIVSTITRTSTTFIVADKIAA